MQKWRLVFKSQWTIAPPDHLVMPLPLTNGPSHPLDKPQLYLSLIGTTTLTVNLFLQMQHLLVKPLELCFMVMQLGCMVLHMHTLEQLGLL